MIVLIDNYDSFTYNLLRYFEENKETVRLIKNDDDCFTIIDELHPEAIIISPGPKTPREAGMSLEVCEKYRGKIPIFGVCLGHQIIAQVYGYQVAKGKSPVHGKVSTIQTQENNIFSGLPAEFKVCRYHSLVMLDDPDNKQLRVEARVKGTGEIMAVSDVQNKVFGVQFHPEALLSEYGHEILTKFMQIARSKDEN